jgi:hypothetical protein
MRRKRGARSAKRRQGGARCAIGAVPAARPRTASHFFFLVSDGGKLRLSCREREFAPQAHPVGDCLTFDHSGRYTCKDGVALAPANVSQTCGKPA